MYNLDDTNNEDVKRSRKSKIKKRPEDWEQLKVEIAQELGLWDKVKESGWSGLSAEDSGRLGGVFVARRRALTSLAEDEANKETVNNVPDAEDVVKAEIFPQSARN